MSSLAARQKTLRIETPSVFQPLIKRARYKGAFGGRGSGKSHFFAEAMIEAALIKPGFRGVCIREVQKDLKTSSKLLIEDKIRKFGLGSEFDEQRAETRTPGGGLIIYQGMQNHTAESIKSLEGFDVAWVEEAQSLSERSLTMLRPTLRKPGSEIWFSWNPRSPTDPVDRMFRGDDAPPLIPELARDFDTWVACQKANYTDNPWFPDVLKAEMLWDQRRDVEKYAHIWLGEYQNKSEARVFHNWKREEFDTPDDARFYFGADWGFSVDPTVLVRCWIKGRTLYVDYEAWSIGCEIDHTPALFAGADKRNPPRWKNPKQWPGISGSTRWPIKADSSNPQSISYMRRMGFENIHPAVKGPGSVEEGVEFLKGYDIIVHPRCQHVVDELTLYSYEVDRQTEEVLPKLADKKNHTIDALRYAVEGVRRAPPSMTIQNHGI